MTSDQATARGGAVPAPRVALGAAIPGRPFPLGATPRERLGMAGTNFAIASSVADRVMLCLFDEAGTENQIPLGDDDADGLAAVDDEIRRVIADVEQNRLPLLAGLVEGVEAAGQLSPDVPPARALDVLWMLSSFEAFDQLLTGRALTVEEVAEILTHLAVRGL